MDLVRRWRRRFQWPYRLLAGIDPHSVAVGDFNGDGKQDLAVANEDLNNVSILLRDCLVSQITPAGTTCSQFSSGTAETLGSVQYDVNNNLIDRVGPHRFLYWVAVTAPAGNNSFRITQTITTGNFNTFFAGKGNGSNVFDSNCVSLQLAIRQSGNTVTVRFNAPAAGTYFIASQFQRAEPQRPTCSQPDSRSLRLHDDGRAGFDQRARSRRTLEVVSKGRRLKRSKRDGRSLDRAVGVYRAG